MSVHRFLYAMMTEDGILDSKEQDHLMMNVARDQTIILGLQIFLDHRSLSSIDQKILMRALGTSGHGAQRGGAR